MEKFVAIFVILCAFSLAQSQVLFDCNLPIPSNVDPSSCCRYSKPFDRLNFPECFGDLILPSSTVKSHLIARDYDDRILQGPAPYYDYTIRPRVTANRRKFLTIGNRQTATGIGRDHYDDEDLPNRKLHYDNRNVHRNVDWHRGDYQSFAGLRHKRGINRFVVHKQPVFAPQVSLRSGVGNGNCAMECIFNQTGITRNNIRFSRDAALIFYSQYFPEIPQDLLSQTVDKCTNDIRSLPSNRNSRTRNTRDRCWNAPGVFAACFIQEIYAQCPDEIRTDSDDCDALRDYIANCSPTG